jgi:hypothetical protein
MFELPRSNDSGAIAIPRQMSIGALLDALEKRYPHLTTDGKGIEASFAFCRGLAYLAQRHKYCRAVQKVDNIIYAEVPSFRSFAW